MNRMPRPQRLVSRTTRGWTVPLIALALGAGALAACGGDSSGGGGDATSHDVGTATYDTYDAMGEGEASDDASDGAAPVCTVPASANSVQQTDGSPYGCQP